MEKTYFLLSLQSGTLRKPQILINVALLFTKKLITLMKFTTDMISSSMILFVFHFCFPFTL